MRQTPAHRPTRPSTTHLPPPKIPPLQAPTAPHRTPNPCTPASAPRPTPSSPPRPQGPKLTRAHQRRGLTRKTPALRPARPSTAHRPRPVTLTSSTPTAPHRTQNGASAPESPARSRATHRDRDGPIYPQPHTGESTTLTPKHIDTPTPPPPLARRYFIPKSGEAKGSTSPSTTIPGQRVTPPADRPIPYNSYPPPSPSPLRPTAAKPPPNPHLSTPSPERHPRRP